MEWICDGIIYIASVLMLFNIIHYYNLIRKTESISKIHENRLSIYVPLILLILFLAGYLAVALVGHPDGVFTGILAGGSLFVFLILNSMDKIVKTISESEQLAHALSKAERASEAKTIFLSNMSHDIRTPMNAIVGYTNIAMRPDTSPEEVREYLGKIDASSQHLLALINDVLEMSRIESGKMDLEPVPVTLCSLLTDVQEMFSTQMQEKHIDFSVRGIHMEDSNVFCDKNRLNRVFLNLLSNAYKFTPEGGKVEVTLEEVSVNRPESADYELRVKDTGIGMSKEFAARIFDAFERDRTATESGIAGTGLGMAITKNIVDLMGGTIRLETSPGEGSEFIINLTLPLAETEDIVDGSPDALERASDETLDYSRIRLLLVEDNEINREIATLMLADFGCLLECAENGKEALEKLEAAEAGYYDAVLMDIQMPVMNGYDATRAIRKLPDPKKCRIPVIAMTANAFAEDIQMAREAGMDEHISKPIDVSKLKSVLDRVAGTC